MTTSSRMNLSAILSLWLYALLCITNSVWAEQAIPNLQARVTDLTGTLTASQREQLEQRLAQFEQRTTNQIAILMLPSTQPEAIEQYAIRVAEAWKVGKKGKDNGVLLIVAKNDRAVRIEVGYGLEGDITDLTSSRIIREIIVPHFKINDYFGGLDAALTAIITRLEGGSPEQAPQAGNNKGASAEGMLPFLVGAAFFMSQLFRSVTNRLIGASIGGSAAGLLAYFLSGSLAAAITIALLGFFLGLFAGMPPPGSYIGRSGSGSWPGSGGFGGGGFRGGGGGFGGGGASGRW